MSRNYHWPLRYEVDAVDSLARSKLGSMKSGHGKCNIASFDAGTEKLELASILTKGGQTAFFGPGLRSRKTHHCAERPAIAEPNAASDAVLGVVQLTGGFPRNLARNHSCTRLSTDQEHRNQPPNLRNGTD